MRRVLAGALCLLFVTASPALAEAPTVITFTPDNVASTYAEFIGVVQARGLPTTYHYDYGTTTSYGQSTAAKSAGSGNSYASFTDVVSGLTPDTTYHYRIVADNADGTGTGTDVSFKTLPAGAIAVLTTIDQAANDSRVADPYPDTKTVTGQLGTITDLNVTLSGVRHRNMDDVNVMLQGPSGQSVLLMANAGSGDNDPVDLTFDQSASGQVPATFNFPSGTYRPTKYDDPDGNDSFPTPAPAMPASSLDAFQGDDPNGQWKLFVLDDKYGNAGQINSWSLDIHTTQGGTPPAAPSQPTPTAGNGRIDFDWPDVPNATSYDVYRYEEGKPVPATPSANRATSDYAATGLTNGKRYCIRVKSRNSAGVSAAFSPEVCATANQIPDKVRGVSSASSNRTLRLEWFGAERASTYEIFPYESGQPQPSDPEVILGSSARSFSFGNLANGSTWCFRVRGRNSAGPGPLSDEHCNKPGKPVFDGFAASAYRRDGGLDFTSTWSYIGQSGFARASACDFDQNGRFRSCDLGSAERKPLAQRVTTRVGGLRRNTHYAIYGIGENSVGYDTTYAADVTTRNPRARFVSAESFSESKRMFLRGTFTNDFVDSTCWWEHVSDEQYRRSGFAGAAHLKEGTCGPAGLSDTVQGHGDSTPGAFGTTQGYWVTGLKPSTAYRARFCLKGGDFIDGTSCLETDKVSTQGEPKGGTNGATIVIQIPKTPTRVDANLLLNDECFRRDPSGVACAKRVKYRKVAKFGRKRARRGKLKVKLRISRRTRRKLRKLRGKKLRMRLNVTMRPRGQRPIRIKRRVRVRLR